jgi:DNA excision repair protein ERCC-4
MPVDSERPKRSFTVAIDTREQLPYAWEGVTCQQATLVAGDYSIIGMESVVAVERKAWPDFYGCLTTGRERFENSLHRLASVRYPAVVIEASMDDFLRPFTYVAAGGRRCRSKLPPLVAQNSLLSWGARYRIPMLLCGERSAASRMTLQHLDVVWRLEREDARQLRREEQDGDGTQAAQAD